MTKNVDDHAARFDEKAAEYDDSKSEEYRDCANLVIDHAAPDADDVVLDLGTGTGAIALALAADAERVVGRDISEGMLEQARSKADERGIDNAEFDTGRFRAPNYGEPVDTDASERSRDDTRVDVVTSNFAMHHLSDDHKREAIDTIAALEPETFVLGDIMFFGEPDPEVTFYSPEVDDPATVGTLADAFTDAGFSLTAVERVHDQVGVLVAERMPAAGEAVTSAPDAEADPE